MQGSLLKFPFSLYQVSLCLSLRDMGLPLMHNILKKKKKADVISNSILMGF